MVVVVVAVVVFLGLIFELLKKHEQSCAFFIISLWDKAAKVVFTLIGVLFFDSFL